MKLLKQGFGYGVVGGVQLGLDWMIFVALTAAGVATGGANVIGRATAAMLGFWLNGKWTFAENGGKPLGMQHFGRYVITWLSMTALSTCIVVATSRAQGMHAAWMVKPAADLVLAALGFTISKYWIYR
ncbi:GtrA family protein [Dyella marensis]|uniref:GtrA-like protein n=1 Tax=Dyella marensis TaxID=500610 RepID=A0A1I2GAX0_9GAMM|nr:MULTISPECIES: GtrA family protein [Dyella]SFF14279.1 GtrA-like protein [Dyella marensis]